MKFLQTFHCLIGNHLVNKQTEICRLCFYLRSWDLLKQINVNLSTLNNINLFEIVVGRIEINRGMELDTNVNIL